MDHHVSVLQWATPVLQCEQRRNRACAKDGQARNGNRQSIRTPPGAGNLAMRR